MDPDNFQDLHFPAAGIDRHNPVFKQPNAPVGPEQKYCRSCRVGENVRGFDPLHVRIRGGSRPGLLKWNPAQMNGSGASTIQDLNILVSAEAGMGQTSLSLRQIRVVGVTEGNVYSAIGTDTSWLAAINDTGNPQPLVTGTTQLPYSAVNVGKLWYVDGTNYCYYDPADNTVHPWVATAGILPRGGDGGTPRLICTWRGRTVLSGLVANPNQWFMSRVNVPTDFDYAPLSSDPTQAVAGQLGPLGLMGDAITALIPFNDDVLFVGCDHSLYMIRGDPNAGGQIDFISDIIGVAWGQAWCRGPDGTIYFHSNRGGVYSIVPGQQPQRMSMAIEEILFAVDTGQTPIRMVWDDHYQGFNIWRTYLPDPATSTHLFWEGRVGAWWQDSFANVDHNPITTCVYDGNLPTDRAVLIGSYDGYVRMIRNDAADDDGTPIQSQVAIGPLITANFDEILLKDLQGMIGATSGLVSWSIYAGDSPETALSNVVRATGTFAAGLNYSEQVRIAGHSIYVVLSSTVQWAMETIRVRLATQGKVRMRGAKGGNN